MADKKKHLTLDDFHGDWDAYIAYTAASSMRLSSFWSAFAQADNAGLSSNNRTSGPPLFTSSNPLSPSVFIGLPLACATCFATDTQHEAA